MQLQVLRLLAARRAVATTITAPASSEAPDGDAEAEEDEGPFFDLDFSGSSVRASSSSAGSASSGSESDDAFTELDFIISLHRTRSASPTYDALFFGAGLAPPPPPLLKFCESEPSAKAAAAGPHARYGSKLGGGLRTLSFGARKAAFYGGRPSFAGSSSSARSLRLFMESPADGDDDEQQAAEEEPEPRRAPSQDVIKRYLTKISRRLRSVRPRSAGGEARGLRRLRKSRSASAAVTLAAPPRRDDSLVEKQDGIASAIAHCKESLHGASLSECDSPLLRSRSDPGKCN
ncbi:uncharacterized protein LOC120697712 [Panicum virgatum]|uniref:Membrane-associated kinase regulator 2 n=1 Tax=Panicum virgatum TaxID=38727 RepID=A0A8T0UTL4_PANVG|nr:uncharacterized protein LOC120697712 [Panicum virgatum]KAG2625478.1 hypothetical protein PVAP13_3KG208149 [Panicum virgatum]